MAAKKRKKAKAKKPRKVKSSKPVAPKKPTKLRHKKARKLSRVELLAQQVKSLQRRLRKYERQQFIGPLLPGKKRKKPSKTEIDTHRSELKLFFEGVKRQLEGSGIASKYRSHENADGSIDTEIRVPLEDSGDVEGHLVDLEDAGRWNDLGEYWISVGLNTQSETETGSPTIDRRPYKPWTHYVRGRRAGAAFFTVTNTIVKKIEEWGGDITMILVSVIWMPFGQQPTRKGLKQ